MRWIKRRDKFLTEAKLRDVLLPRQKKEVSQKWGEIFLDYEEIEASDNIKQGKWKLSEKDKRAILGVFLMADIDSVYKTFEDLPEKFIEVANASIELEILSDRGKKLMNDFNIQQPTINQIGALTDTFFRKISTSETMSDEMIARDENGRPVMGEDGKPTKIGKEKGQVIYSKNLTNINTFVEDYNRCFPDSKVDSTIFRSGDIARLVSSSKEDFGGDDYNVDIDIFGRDMYLSINHNAKDILNISISRFYSSCQHLYSGGQRNKLIGNVFDPNTCPAFLIFDSPIYNSSGELISEQLPLTRMLIRNIETWNPNDDPQIFFDRAYPDRTKDLFGKIIEKYSGNVENYDSTRSYLFTPDLPEDSSNSIVTPYMDILRVERGTLIGVNTKTLNLSSNIDWSTSKISPKASIEYLTIETTFLPDNLFEIKIQPQWVKFKFLKIFSLESFKNLKSKSFAFDKCSFNNNILVELLNNNPDLEKVQFTACDIKDIDLSILKGIKELHLIYTLESEESIKDISQLGLSKLVISGDILSSKDTKKIITDLKKSGTKVEIVGPNI